MCCHPAQIYITILSVADQLCYDNVQLTVSDYQVVPIFMCIPSGAVWQVYDVPQYPKADQSKQSATGDKYATHKYEYKKVSLAENTSISLLNI